VLGGHLFPDALDLLFDLSSRLDGLDAFCVALELFLLVVDQGTECFGGT
jgi:hypothetical protein